MKPTPSKPPRKPLRLKHYNYSQTGFYFITICIQDFRCLFSEVVGEAMILNGAGVIIKTWLLEIEKKFPNVKLDEFIIMPNHFHAIIEITDTVGAGFPRPHNAPPSNIGRENPAPTLGQIVGYFKYQSTKHVNLLNQTPAKKLWQKNYYEHIIRTEETLKKIREYIATNPLKWRLDKLYVK